MKLTVFYEGEFWVGVAETSVDGKVKAFRYVFGAEPHDAEVLEFVQRIMLPGLESVTRAAGAKPPIERRTNPKRRAREAAREVRRSGVGTAAQEALKLELEHRKRTRKAVSREDRLSAQERKRELARLKAKAKHRGR